MLFVIATQVTQENRQDSATDFVSIPGNQQGLYYPPYPHPIPPTPPPIFWNPEIPPTPPPMFWNPEIPPTPPIFWNPETGWWTYYPMPPYFPYEHYPQPYYYYHPQFYSIDDNTIVDVGNQMAMTQFPPDHYLRDSELTENNGDECAIAFRGNPLSRNSTFYVGSQWRHDTPTTPTSCSTTEPSDRLIGEHPLTSSSPLSSMSSENDSESVGEDRETEDVCRSSSKRGDNEEHASTESSESSCDSDSYMAYSTGLNPQNNSLPPEVVGDNIEKANGENSDSTDGDNENMLEDEQDVKEEEKDAEEAVEKISQTGDQDDATDTTVSVSLPLRFKFSVSDNNEDVTTLIVGDSTVTRDTEACVNFTLKRPSSQEIPINKVVQEIDPVKPSFIVTTTDEDQPEVTQTQKLTTLGGTNIEDKRNQLLKVQSSSREEVTDDEDSGVTSDMSRMISEVDTDSECCLTTTTISDSSVTKRTGSNKYQRTQTHSRLFKLLSDEQLKLPTIDSSLPNHEENSSNSSGLTSPDCTVVDQPNSCHSALRSRHQLPTRPKSLDCEALFKHQHDQQDSYYQTWKSGERSPRRSPVSGHWTRQRVNVLCPRTNSAKNLLQILTPKNYHQQLSRMKSPLGSTMIPSSIPSPIRTSKRC